MRNTVIDNLRGVCMLGVLAIHVGSLALQPDNLALYVILEVLSRYSVPTFFFISGFGLVSNDITIAGELSDKGFSYGDFLRRRLPGIVVPYLFWSLFYIMYFKATLPEGSVNTEWGAILHTLLFGLACYHLYFMTILICFYLSYPLWRSLVKLCCCHLTSCLVAVFTMQLLFNLWSVHTGIDVSDWPLWAQNMFLLRLNYLPLHYVFVFTAGGVAALFWAKYSNFLLVNKAVVASFFAAASAWCAGSCWYSFHYEGYNLIALANTYHQLSPQGLVYTAASILFFTMLLLRLERAADGNGQRCLAASVKILATNATFVYFIHPLLLDWLQNYYSCAGIVMTVKKVIFSYIFLLLASILCSEGLRRIAAKNRFVRMLVTGKK